MPSSFSSMRPGEVHREHAERRCKKAKAREMRKKEERPQGRCFERATQQRRVTLFLINRCDRSITHAVGEEAAAVLEQPGLPAAGPDIAGGSRPRRPRKPSSCSFSLPLSLFLPCSRSLRLGRSGIYRGSCVLIEFELRSSRVGVREI
jgi:hypothetical protein